MTYVMVPVPEDQVQEVMQYVLRLINQASIEPWDEASVTDFFDSVDEPTRALLSAVAAATLRDEPIREADAVSAIQMNRREMVGIMREVNDLARDAGRQALIQPRTVEEAFANGRTREVRVLAMVDDVARYVVEADRRHLLAGDDLPVP
jgi:predicted ATP-dependent protease